MTEKTGLGSRRGIAWSEEAHATYSGYMLEEDRDKKFL